MGREWGIGFTETIRRQGSAVELFRATNSHPSLRSSCPIVTLAETNRPARPPYLARLCRDLDATSPLCLNFCTFRNT